MKIKNIHTEYIDQIDDLVFPSTVEIFNEAGDKSYLLPVIHPNEIVDLSALNSDLKIISSLRLVELINSNEIVVLDEDNQPIPKSEALDKFKKIAKFTEGETKLLAPAITKVSNIVFRYNTQKTVRVTGGNFDIDTKVSIEGTNWDGQILSKNVVNDKRIDITILSGITSGRYDLILDNGGKRSDTFATNKGQNAIKVFDLPDGEEKLILIAGSAGDFYEAQAFAKAEYNNGFRAERAFDGNSGTRHYTPFNQAVDHYFGVIMSQDTYFTSINLATICQTTDFRLEGSDDTTDGNDGTWTTILEDTFPHKETIDFSDQNAVYRALRIVVVTPANNSLFGVEEVSLQGRQ